MNFELLFDIKLNDDIDKNWLKFKNETTLLYTYYYEMSRDECIGIFKLVQLILTKEMVNHSDDYEKDAMEKIRYIKKDLKKHLEYLRNFKEI